MRQYLGQSWSRVSRRIDGMIRHVETVPLSVGQIAGLFGALIVIRLLLVRVNRGFPPADAVFQYYNATHIALFFALTSIAVVAIVAWSAAVPYDRAVRVVAVGLPVMLIAPIVEPLLSGASWQSGFYEMADPAGLWRAFSTFYVDSTGAVTVGSRVEMAAVIFGAAAYTGLRRHSVVYAAIAGIVTYGALFVLSAIPSLVVIGVGVVMGHAQDGLAVATMFLSPHRILVRDVADVAISVHLHLIAVLTPLFVVCGVGVAARAGLSLRVAARTVIEGIGMFGIGAVAGIALSGVTLRELGVSPFAVPAFVTMGLAAGAVSLGTWRTVGTRLLAVIGVAVAGTLQPMTGLLLLVALAMVVAGRILGMLWNLRDDLRERWESIIGAAAHSAVFVAGIAAVTPYITLVARPALLAWIFVGLCGIAVMRSVHTRPARLSVAIGAFVFIVGGIPVFNLFAFAAPVIGAAAAVFLVVVYGPFGRFGR